MKDFMHVRTMGKLLPKRLAYDAFKKRRVLIFKRKKEG